MLFAFTDFVRISNFEEPRGDFDEPLGLNCRNGVTILPCRKDKVVIDEPLGRSIEQSAGRMDIDRGAFNERFVPFLRVFLRRIAEETRTNGPPNAIVVATGRKNVVLISDDWRSAMRGYRPLKILPIHDAQKLLPDVLSSPHTPCLNEVLVTPRV